ncbi:MAG: hypothetical protein A2289_20720 [Deltaproteobacteria bacterium RIFOXYA12_FULL_58_15]|nr:MAG: hypothetical protein A2289_20720 [Deltaproteobacteria bacterium RIFOXYA12_FULL_58_15]OGR08416.1 MAG: hypothetical protein A2341_17410 [Deltaproteobacteria bacterium RIFOXYB12_FULL_58_9]
MRRLGLLLFVAATCLLWAFLAHAEEQETRSFGLVVGTNISNDPDVKPLRYADDDAVNNAKLMGELGAQVVLLVGLDYESKKMFPEIQETPPTRNAIEQAMARLNQMMEKARSQGQRPIFYFFYSGHGDVDNNRGYVNLKDGRFWREDLMALLAQSAANENHVVIDACKSYFLVFDRGKGGERAPLSGSLIGDKSSLPTNTGVVLSTSSAADSHEWEAFQAGVFSHEVRSALRGAADQNLDGQVTYEEAAAFVWGANVSVPNPKFRPNVFVHAPGEKRADEAVLADMRATRVDNLVVGPGVTEHLYIEDQAGRRLADLRPAPEQTVSLLLPKERPLFVRQSGSDEEVELPQGNRLVLAALPKRVTTVARRGAEHVAFRSLFSRPFGQQTVIDYRNCPPEAVEIIETHRDLTWLRRGTGILGLGAALLGGTMTGLSARESSSVKPRTAGTKRKEVNDRIDRYNIVAVTSYALAGVGLATYLVWTLWPEKPVEIQVMPNRETQVRISVGF